MTTPTPQPATDNGLAGLDVALGVSLEESHQMRRATATGQRSPLSRMEYGEPWQVPKGHPWHDK